MQGRFQNRHYYGSLALDESSALSVPQHKVTSLETVISPCNPMWLAGMGDTALPRWHCSRWWMMPCWTSLRGASHDCSFQGALLHTAAWETAWKLISINSQPSSRTISKHNFRAVQHYYFPPPPLFDNELAEWCSFDEYDSVVRIIWTWPLLQRVLVKRCRAKAEKFNFSCAS